LCIPYQRPETFERPHPSGRLFLRIEQFLFRHANGATAGRGEQESTLRRLEDAIYTENGQALMPKERPRFAAVRGQEPETGSTVGHQPRSLFRVCDAVVGADIAVEGRHRPESGRIGTRVQARDDGVPAAVVQAPDDAGTALGRSGGGFAAGSDGVLNAHGLKNSVDRLKCARDGLLGGQGLKGLDVELVQSLAADIDPEGIGVFRKKAFDGGREERGVFGTLTVERRSVEDDGVEYLRPRTGSVLEAAAGLVGRIEDIDLWAGRMGKICTMAPEPAQPVFEE
jgi:hypothetical protein